MSNWWLEYKWWRWVITPTLKPSQTQSPVASFTKEVNPRLAKRPLKINGHLANPELTSLVKETTVVYMERQPKSAKPPVKFNAGLAKTGLASFVKYRPYMVGIINTVTIFTVVNRADNNIGINGVGELKAPVGDQAISSCVKL